jgi:hypothetical protein
MCSDTEIGVEYVVKWEWESVDNIPNNRYRQRTEADARRQGAALQGQIAGLVGGTVYPSFIVLSRNIERTTVVSDWKRI